MITLKRPGYPTITRDDRPGAKFNTRIRYQGKVHYFTLTELADTSFTAALSARRELQAGRWAALKDQTRLRAECSTTLGEIQTAYRKYQPAPPKVLAKATKEKNLHALKNLLRKAGIDYKDALPVSTLTGELVYKWKQAILAECRDKSPEDATRHCRSANSILIQARSIFADEARTYLERAAKLVLPVSLEKFRKEPGFKQIAKTEYHAPNDLVIAKTFAHLASIAPPPPSGEVSNPTAGDLPPSPPRSGRGTEGEVSNPADAQTFTCLATRNEYLACWLALGFGLRASEIAQCRKEDFQDVAGDSAFRPPWYGKNKKRTPEVLVQLDAWQHLGPHIAALPARAYVLSGHETERTSDVFRRISGWMRALGWETTHHIHELRAWAGSYIADHASGDGIRSAQIFLRHASYATTEKFYGHHRKQQLAKVKLTIPKVQPTAPAAEPLPANVVRL